jgi:hypothetical protein
VRRRPEEDEEEEDEGVQVSDPVTADHPMSTGKHPAMPPQTMFCSVRRFRIIV